MDNYVLPEAKDLLKKDNITIDWTEISRVMLKQSHYVNPLATQPNRTKIEDDILVINLELLTTENKLRKKSDNPKASPRELFQIIMEKEKSKTLITGRPGSGKTLLMKEIANLVLSTSDNIVIWISLADLGKDSLEEYLTSKWLKWAARTPNSPSQMWQESFKSLLQSGKVWLFLDNSQELLNSYNIDNFNSTKEIITPSDLINKELKGSVKNLRIILTSRTKLGEKELDRLSDWQIYTINPLTYPEETTAFIEHWFKATDSQLTEPLNKQFREFLEELSPLTGSEWIANPLHLALLCRHWQQSSKTSLKTIDQLYQKGVNQYYEWKAEKVTTSSVQRELLNQRLAELALITLEEEGSLKEIPQKYFTRVFQNEPQLGILAIQIGWLNVIAIKREGEYRKIYQFFDQTFAEYFASLAIDQWQFFLQNQAEKDLRIFDRAWEKVILFWTGRSKSEEKEAFIEYLTEFKDDCGKHNYYGKRAYFLAAKILIEYPESNRLLLIIYQLLKWIFSESSLITQGIIEKARQCLEEIPGKKSSISLIDFIRQKEDGKTYRIALKILERISQGNPQVVAMLSDLIEQNQSDDLKQQCAESLLRLSPNHEKAMTTLIKILEATESEEVRQNTFNALEKVGVGNITAINAIIRLLTQTSPRLSQKRLFQCLEKIGKYNSTAIAFLVQLIRTTDHPIKQRQAAESLEKIDPGNPTALAVLTQLMQDFYEETVRKEAIYSLGEIESGHQEVIQALIEQIKNAPEMLIRWLAISSLGKIAQGDQESVEVLSSVIHSTEDYLLRKEAIDSLLKIAPNASGTVSTLLKLLQSAPDEETRREVAENLGKIDPGNRESITALTELLQSTSDPYTRKQVAFSLSQIDTGNLQALTTLITLVNSQQNGDLSILAIDSLGEIAFNNPAVIATLIRVISSNRKPGIIRSAVKSLGRIQTGSTESVHTLLELLGQEPEKSLRNQIAESLIKILRPQDLLFVVKKLPSLLLAEKEGSAIEQIMWYCVENLAYPQFYQAWHEAGEKVATTENVEPITFNELSKSLEKSPQLAKKGVHLIWIDTEEFLEPENPALDIYDQMLAQNCPEFTHGLPESMVKLRLYWHWLEREKIQSKHPVLLVFSKKETPHNLHLWQILEKFKGTIALITEEQSITPMTSFCLENPGILTSILNWLELKIPSKKN